MRDFLAQLLAIQPVESGRLHQIVKQKGCQTVMKTRKKRITYAEVDAGLNRYWMTNHLPFTSPTWYIVQLKRETGLADWKIAHDLSVDSGVEVASQTVRLWRVKGEKGL